MAELSCSQKHLFVGRGEIYGYRLIESAVLQAMGRNGFWATRGAAYRKYLASSGSFLNRRFWAVLLVSN